MGIGRGEGRGGEEEEKKGGGRERRGKLLAIYPLSLWHFNYILSPPQMDIIFSVFQMKKMVFRKIK